MPKLWKIFAPSSKSNNDRTGSSELKRRDTKSKKNVVSNDKDITKKEDLSSSLIQNRLVLQEFMELQNGIVNDVAFLINGKPKDVVMKVDLLGVHVYDKDNTKQLIKEFEVEQIIQYSYERDKQYLTLSYMNSEYAVESYDFVTPDYFEIFDFIGHVIAMVIKMNNQKYEAEEENVDDDSSFQLPRISTMYNKSSDSTNIFSPTFILNNFMPESTHTSTNYLFDDQNACSSSSIFPDSDEKVDGKDLTDSESKSKNNMKSDYAISTPNLFINTTATTIDNNKSTLTATPQSAVEIVYPLDRKNVDNANKNNYRKSDFIETFDTFDKRSSNQYRTVRHHMSSGKFDVNEIPAYGKKYGTIHYRKSHDIDDIYTSEIILNSNPDGNDDKNHQEISNQTQAKVNLMKYFVENRYNIDKKKAYSIGAILDDNDNDNRHGNSDEELSVNIGSSRDTIETSKEEEKEKKKHKHKLHISKTNVSKACEEVSPSIELLDEMESPTKKSSKMSKMKYSFARPKSLQLNFLTYKDSSKKRISIKNAGDINDIYTPSYNDGDLENEKNKSQKRKSNVRRSKLVPLKKGDSFEDFENDENIKNDNELIGVIPDDDTDSKKDVKSIQFYNPLTDEIEEKPIDESIRTSLFNLPKVPSDSSDIQGQGKNESDLLSAYLEAYSSSPGSKVYSTAVSTIKLQNDSRLSSTYPKEFINSINANVLSPMSNESNFEILMNESEWNNKNDNSNDDSSKLLKNKKKTQSVIVDSPKIDRHNNIRAMSGTYKSEEIINLDLNIIKEQYNDMSKSSDCLNDKKDKVIGQNGGQQIIIVNNNQRQQLHKYKSKQIMNYRTIHGVSPFVSQTNPNSVLSTTSPSLDKNSKTKSSHNDIYSTFRKFVGKNQKTKASINDINFDSSPDKDGNKLPQIEKEYEDGKEYLIRTLKDNHYEVTAGTVHALIDEMILNNSTDIMFIDIFLLTYRHFLKANDFVMLLTEEFNKLVEKANDDNNSDINLQIQKIASVIKKWVAEYFNDFVMSSDALKSLNSLIDTMKNSDKAHCQSYIDQINSLIKYGLKQAEEESDEDTNNNNNNNLTNEVDLVDILNISSKKIAQQLTLVDSKIWRSIESPEYAHFLWDNKEVKEKNTKNIQKFIERFNQISFWVSTMICKTESLKTRGNVLEKMIKVAKYCLEIQNFNTTMAILSGLNMAAVSRLKGTWMTLSTKTMNTYTEIEEAMSYKCNYKNYRDLEYNAKPPFIPFFGLLLKDLTFMNDGNQKILKNELINFQKLRIIYTKIKSYNLIQKNLYNFQPDNSIIEVTKHSQSDPDNTTKHEIEMSEYFSVLPHYKEMTLLEFSRKIENSNSKANVLSSKAQSKGNLEAVNENENSNTTKSEKVNNTTKNTNLVELFQQ